MSPSDKYSIMPIWSDLWQKRKLLCGIFLKTGSVHRMELDIILHYLSWLKQSLSGLTFVAWAASPRYRAQSVSGPWALDSRSGSTAPTTRHVAETARKIQQWYDVDDLVSFTQWEQHVIVYSLGRHSGQRLGLFWTRSVWSSHFVLASSGNGENSQRLDSIVLIWIDINESFCLGW